MSENLVQTRQLASLAELGQRALAGGDVSTLMTDAAISIAQILEVGYVAVFELISDNDTLCLRAGVGWQDGLINQTVFDLRTAPLTSHALISGESHIIESLEQESVYVWFFLMRSHNINSGLRVVIQGQARPLGILGAYTTGQRSFTESDLHFLQAMANVLATTIERERSQRQIDGLNRGLLTLRSVGTAITSSLDLEDVLSTVAVEITQLLSVPGCAISEWRPLDNTLYLLVDHGPESWVDIQPRGTLYHLSDYPLTKRALIEQTAIQLTRDQATGDPAELDYMSKAQIETLLMLPMVFQDRVIGLVEVIDDWTRRVFTDQEMALGQLLANQAANAIENARLYQQAKQEIAKRRQTEAELKQRHQELLSLQTAGIAITSTLDLDRVLEQVAREMLKLLSVAGCVIYEWQPDPNSISVLFETGPDRWAQEPQVGLSFDLTNYPMTQQVLQEQRPQQIRLDQIYLDSGELAYMQKEGFKTLLMLPMIFQERIVGLLELGDDQKTRRFSQEEISLAQLLTNQAASAIENGRIYAEVTRQADELSTLLEAARTISSTLDLEKLLRLIAEQMARSIKVTGCTISRWERESNAVVTWIKWGHPDVEELDRPGTAYKLDEYDVARIVLEERRPVVVQVSDPEADPAEVALMHELNMGSLLCLPLAAGKDVIGIVELDDERERNFTPREVNLCQALCDQAALAIENAQLYEQVQRNVYNLEQRVAERTQELALARDQALAASHLKSELLAKVSHELRTPLNAIMGFAEITKMGIYGSLTDEQAEAMTEIINSAGDLTALVDELLNQIQLDAGQLTLHPTWFAPVDLIQQVILQMNVLAETKNLHLTSEVDPDVPEILVGDPARLKQILANLVGNAIKFTETGSVKARIYLADEDHWGVQVSDTGPGIPATAQAYIFEPFRQVDGSTTRKHGGAGLGLSIVKQLTALMGGKIELASQIGQGSQFSIILPLHQSGIS